MAVKVTLKQAVGGHGRCRCWCFPPLMDFFSPFIVDVFELHLFWILTICLRLSFMVWILYVFRAVCLLWEERNLNLKVCKVQQTIPAIFSKPRKYHDLTDDSSSKPLTHKKGLSLAKRKSCLCFSSGDKRKVSTFSSGSELIFQLQGPQVWD